MAVKGYDYLERIVSRLTNKYGESLHTELGHKNITDLFVAVFLSPQCTDKQVNKVTVKLFRRFRSFDDYADVDLRTLRRYLRGLNYYKTKARNLRRSAKIIRERFDGRVPSNIHKLMELPGVGRKVANVVLNEGFGINQGIAVDTHCGRVSGRLGLSGHKDPNRIEMDLLKRVPRGEWGMISNLFIALGRDACKARNKECDRCILRDICPSSYARNKPFTDQETSMLSSG